MGVYIKGMEMPTRCGECSIVQKTKSAYRCPLASKAKGFSCVTSFGSIEIPEYCPLIKVPEPHGDLIDKNELTMCGYDLDNYFWFRAVPEETLNEARVIIPASEEGVT